MPIFAFGTITIPTDPAGSGTKYIKAMKTYRVIEKATGRDITPGFEGQLPFFRLTVVNGKYHVISDMGKDITDAVSFVKC